MVRKTMKALAVALIAAFALSSMAEAAVVKKTRHRPKHSTRVASGAAVTTAKKPAAKKKAAPAASGTQAKATTGKTTTGKAAATKKATAKKAPAKRRPTTKPR